MTDIFDLFGNHPSGYGVLHTRYSDEELQGMLGAIGKWPGSFHMLTPQGLIDGVTKERLVETIGDLSMKVEQGELVEILQPSPGFARVHGRLAGNYRVSLMNKYRIEAFHVLRYTDGSYECVNGRPSVFIDYGPEVELEKELLRNLEILDNSSGDASETDMGKGSSQDKAKQDVEKKNNDGK